MVLEITASQNSKIKFVRSLLQKKNRIKNQMYTVEGIKSVNDAIDAHADVEMIFVSKVFFENNSFDYCDVPCYCIPESIFELICDTKTPQGILAVINMPKICDFLPDKEKLYIYCDGVSDPGNLGTIIRTADAAGFGGVLLSPGCAELYSPKTIRSSMGSFFHIPVFENIGTDDIKSMKADDFNIFCGALCENTIPYTDADYTCPSVIVVGNEANGISENVLKMSDFTVKIPILGAAESLNVGIAAAVIMYEAVRQRNKKNID